MLTNMTANDTQRVDSDYIIKGDCGVPEKLREFFSYLVKGSNYHRRQSDDDNIKIDSLCQDVIYIVTKGRVKPAKHLMVGICMKSLTSSRKVLTILNKCGHSIGYTAAEELETEITYTAYENNQLIPAGIKLRSDLSTHVAFDNYDRFVDTLSGKDTLHDTVGIIY